MREDDKGLADKELTNKTQGRLQTSLQKDSENDPKKGGFMSPELMKIIEAWPELPYNIKMAVMVLVDTQ